MEILPLESLHDEDAPLVGTHLINLSKLKTWKLPVPDGLVILPPEFHLQTVLKHYNLTDKEIFEQNLTIIKKDILRIPLSEELIKALKHKNRAEELWHKLLEVWLQEIRTRIWQTGFSPSLTRGLSAQPIFFVGSIKYTGESYFNPESEEFDHLGDGSKLRLPQREIIEDTIKSANKRLFLPHVYRWIVDKKARVWIIKLIPYTHPLKKPEVFEAVHQAHRSNQAEIPETVTKVFLDISNTLVVSHEVDGFMINAEQVIETDKPQVKFESQVFKLVETAASFKHLPVIFKLSDSKRQAEDVRGALKLIHTPDIIQQESTALLFARNQKQLSNVEVAIPFVRSVHEFSEVKRMLTNIGLKGRGSLKVWLEMAVPENLIHLDDYLKIGLEGVILNLDELSAFLGGFDPKNADENFYARDIDAMMVFLAEGMKRLHQAKVPMIARGNLAIHSEVLDLLIERGIYGVVVSLGNSYSFKHHLHFLEKRILRKRTA